MSKYAAKGWITGQRVEKIAEGVDPDIPIGTGGTIENVQESTNRFDHFPYITVRWDDYRDAQRPEMEIRKDRRLLYYLEMSDQWKDSYVDFNLKIAGTNPYLSEWAEEIEFA